MEASTERNATQRFRWGLLLAWIPLTFFLIPTVLGIVVSVASPQKATGQKATGLGAVAGGFSESLATFGLVATIGCEVSGIVLLVGAVSRSQPVRGVVAIISVCFSALLLFVLALFLWFAVGHWR